MAKRPHAPRPWWDRLHWPTVALAGVTLACMVAAPIAFLVLVPERLVDKVLHLPWTTILAVGTPALAAAVGALRGAFMGPVVRPAEAPVPAAVPAVLEARCQACGQVLPLPESDPPSDPEAGA